MSFLRQDLRSSTCFTTSFFSSWICLALTLLDCQNSSNLITILFGLFVTLGTTFILRNFSYFNSLCPTPSKGDIISVLFAVSCSGCLVFSGFYIVLGYSICNLKYLLISTITIGTISYFFDFIYSKYIKKTHKRKIVLDILPEEAELLKAEIRAKGYYEGLEFLTTTDLRKAVLNNTLKKINLIVISKKTSNSFDVDGMLLRAHLAGVEIINFQNLESDITGRVRLSHTDQWEFILEATKQTFLLRLYRNSKSLFEPLLATALLTILSPLFLVIAIAIKLTSTGPVFYKQTRTGYLGKTFTLIKFRSMVIDAEKDGPQWSTGKNDQRVTKFGTFLRNTRLDELPQLINVIKKEMGFFGPRPERPEIYQKLKDEIPLFKMRTLVLPGITGWAQVCAGYAATVEESKKKLEYDLYYIKRITPRLELSILLKTIYVACFGEKTKKEELTEYEHPRKLA